MNSFWIILFHTYVSKLKTKSFIMTTIDYGSDLYCLNEYD